MAQIYANTRHTILLCMVALIVSVGVGIFTASWITRPLNQIAQASEYLAGGALNQNVASSRIWEIETLTNSFNSMARQLQESFETLEDKVKERTSELATATKQIAALNQLLKAENLRMSSELDMLKQMQQLILPKPAELAAIEDLDIAGFMEPASEVGGDYYDVLCTNGVVTICIGDVTGHGLESGILMVMTQALLNYADRTISISGQHEETLVVRKGGKIQRIDTINLGFPLGLHEDISDWISHV